jgi:hypothetical protein
MRPKHYKSREELSAALAKEVEELNNQIERLKMTLEHPEMQAKVSGVDVVNANDLRLHKEPSSVTLG